KRLCFPFKRKRTKNRTIPATQSDERRHGGHWSAFFLYQPDRNGNKRLDHGRIELPGQRHQQYDGRRKRNC
ncbi:MAG: hypothetical protein ACRDE5_06920, partial [Ginsengibacter sp.]